MAAACGQTALPPPRQRPRQRAHLRCETQPGASAQPHGGSLRANGRCHRFATALASARTFGAKHSRGLPPNRSAACSAAWRQPAGKRPCHRSVNALASARTFGGKHSLGLPPNRSAACSAAWRQPAGKRPLPPLRHRPRQRAHLRWETQPGASAQPLSGMLSRMAAACGQTAPPPPRRRPREGLRCMAPQQQKYSKFTALRSIRRACGDSPRRRGFQGETGARRGWCNFLSVHVVGAMANREADWTARPVSSAQKMLVSVASDC